MIALKLGREAIAKKQALSIGLLGNAAEVFPELVKRNCIPDIVTDQTSAHDELNGYVPYQVGYRGSIRNACYKSLKNILTYLTILWPGIARLFWKCRKEDAIAFDYGNNLRAQAKKAGVTNAFDYPGFVPAYIRPLFCEGKGPFRWVALSGEPEDIYKTDELIVELFKENKSLVRWINLAQKKVEFQGLPSRICWLGLGERAKFGKALNQLVRDKVVKAPIVIGRDHLDTGSVASPYRETEGMKDGSDAISDWPILNGLINVASGASWVSFHHGGGVGMGYSQHAGQVVVADGTEEMDIET